jgi:outer membrane protein OmpA-like peptidoglycan-associated protein
MSEQTPARHDKFYLGLSVLMVVATASWWAWDRLSDDATVATNSAQAGYQNADTDGDGVTDLSDQCPTLAGIVANQGCPPDGDADGIADVEDRCPEVAGTAALLGCPMDSDADGISDDTDHCPGLAGTAADRGCPADSDGDGVFDLDDKCPQQAGDDGYGCAIVAAAATAANTPTAQARIDCSGEHADNSACDKLTLDADSDGIPDQHDRCPAHPAPQTTDGCPADADADGVADAMDECPDQKGATNGNGCPIEQDSDLDGVTDEVDDCPSVAGIVARHGCPADRDADGVADGDDLCPNTAGATNLRGCPPQPEDMVATPSATTAPAAPIEATQQTIEIAASLPVAPQKIRDEPPLDTRLGQVKTYPAAVIPADTPISAEDRDILNSAIALLEFEPDSATLTGDSANALMNVADLLKRYPDAVLEISGHTDSSGDASTNMELSKDRARACALFFMQNGIPTSRLRAAGFGESRPIASNATPEGRRINRRVEFNLAFAE